MQWPLIRNIPPRMNFIYVRFAGVLGTLSLILCLLSLVAAFTGGLRENPIQVYQQAEGSPLARLGTVLGHGFNLGIDFRGGTAATIQSPEPIDFAAMRALATEIGEGGGGVQGASCRPTDSPPYCAILSFESGDRGSHMVDLLRARLGEVAPGATVVNVDVVGSAVSEELFAGGLIALGLATLLMMVYIWFRFEWQFGLGAAIGLLHDVILTLGLFSVMRYEFSLTIIAALLTIIGYSLNDTIVVYDRIRENLRKYKKMPLSDLIDLSLNETLARTIMTGVTTVMALVALLYLGGDALSGFAIAMIVGILIGTYSSIYVCAPILLLWGVGRSREGGKRDAGKAQPAAGG